MHTEGENHGKHVVKKYGPKSVMAQLLATIAHNSLFVGSGMNISVAVIVIRDLYNKPNSDFSMTVSEASWYASLMFIIHPIGCFLSGILQAKYGKKWCMVFANVPNIVGWILLYLSYRPAMLNASTLLMGFSSGVGAGSTSSYVGEISEPRLRGSLGSLGNTSMWLGSLSIYIMGSLFDWRTVALLSMCCPIISIGCIVFIPESPIWLLAKGKTDRAEKSMRWLRGWVKTETIELEFINLLYYNKVTGACKTNAADADDKSLLVTLAELKDPSIYKPLKLMIFYYFISFMVSMYPVRPYISSLLNEADLPYDQSRLLILFSSLACFGCIVSTTTVHVLGKRLLTLLTLTINSVILFLLGAYIFALKNNYTQSYPWIPLSFICGIYFFGTCGVASIPWMLLIEVFPNKNRGIATGVCTGMTYILLFILIKTYLPIATVINLEYILIIYGCIGFFGLVYFYFYLPETENKTLLEIEEFFASN